MSAEDLNDIRAAVGALTHSMRSLHEKVDDAVGALTHSMRSLHEKVDDLTARHATFTGLQAIVDEMNGWLDELPAALDRIQQDPTLGMFIGPFVGPLIGSFRAAQDKMRTLREPPAIESIPLDTERVQHRTDEIV